MKFPMYVYATKAAVHATADTGSQPTTTLIQNKEIEAVKFDPSGCWAGFQMDGKDAWCQLKYLMPRSGGAVPWLVAAQGEIGVDNSSAEGQTKIISYMKEVKKLSKEQKNDPINTDWCACFIDWCMLTSKQPREASPRAKDWQAWGKPRATGNTLLGDAKLGDLAIGEREKAGGGKGHVAIFLAWDEDKRLMLILGGNQGASPFASGGKKGVRYSWYPKESLPSQPYGKLLSLHYQ